MATHSPDGVIASPGDYCWCEEQSNDVEHPLNGVFCPIKGAHEVVLFEVEAAEAEERKNPESETQAPASCKG